MAFKPFVKIAPLMKPKPPKEIRERRAEKPAKDQKQPVPKKANWLKILEVSIAVASLIIGIAGLILVLWSGPTISMEPPLDPDKVLTTPFVLSNDGMLTLEDVRVALLLRDFEHAN